MPLKKEKEELRAKALVELEQVVRDAKRELYDIRTKIATRQQEDNNRSKHLRRRLARVYTIINEKKAAAAREDGGES